MTVNNGAVRAHRKLSSDYHPDAICILELFVNPSEEFGNRYETESEWLKQYWQNGGVIGAACTGALLLAETGLLDGLEATTHWGACDAMANRYPKIKIKSNCTFITTGDQQRLILAGGGCYGSVNNYACNIDNTLWIGRGARFYLRHHRHAGHKNPE